MVLVRVVSYFAAVAHSVLIAMTRFSNRFAWSLVLILLLTPACSRIYYNTMESFGYQKREILVDRVEDTRESQEEAKEQFQTALERFSELTNFDGGDLEKLYNRLEKEFERSEKRAEDVRDHIDDVEDVAQAMFREWEQELEQYSDANLRRASEEQLETTRAEYDQLLRAMRRAEDKMDPVLDTFRDQVLFLKHNLNARAISSLENTVAGLETDVGALIADMEASIDEASRFIDGMQG